MVSAPERRWCRRAWSYGFVGFQVFFVTFVFLCVLGFLIILIWGYLILRSMS